MVEFASNTLDVIIYICMGIGVIACTIVGVAFAGLLLLGMLEEFGFIDFLKELKNNKSNT